MSNINKINKNICCSSINTTSSYNNNNIKSIISKESYSSILYLIVKKGWTYFGELKSHLNITTNFHLDKLQELGLIQRREVSIEEKEWILKLNKRIPKDTLNNLNVVELSEIGFNLLTSPKMYDLIQFFSRDGIDDYIILQREKFNNLKREEEEKKQKEEEQFRRMLKNKGWEIQNEKN